jgi:hypothetical protein
MSTAKVKAAVPIKAASVGTVELLGLPTGWINLYAGIKQVTLANPNFPFWFRLADRSSFKFATYEVFTLQVLRSKQDAEDLQVFLLALFASLPSCGKKIKVRINGTDEKEFDSVKTLVSTLEDWMAKGCEKVTVVAGDWFPMFECKDGGDYHRELCRGLKCILHDAACSDPTFFRVNKFETSNMKIDQCINGCETGKDVSAFVQGMGTCANGAMMVLMCVKCGCRMAPCGARVLTGTGCFC